MKKRFLPNPLNLIGLCEFYTIYNRVVLTYIRCGYEIRIYLDVTLIYISLICRRNTACGFGSDPSLKVQAVFSIDDSLSFWITVSRTALHCTEQGSVYM
jgi:hypothetical protein